MGRRRKHNADTYCGCKVCEHLHMLTNHWYCMTCRMYVKKETARENHETSIAHRRTVERLHLQSLFGEDYMSTSWKLPAEQLLARGFTYYSDFSEKWFGPADKDTVNINILLGTLPGSQSVVLIPFVYANDHAWNAMRIIVAEEDAAERSDMLLDLYLKVKRGEYT